jgi:ElaB/YqjD/DUF883 family membrane-anchored ribosome-binding protein
MKKWSCILFLFLFFFLYLHSTFAADEKDGQYGIQKSVEEILSTVNNIIKSTIELAEEELEKLHNHLKDRGTSIKKETGESLAKGLQSILGELRKLEMALKEMLDNTKDATKKKMDRCMRDLDEIGRDISKYRDTIKNFADRLERESGSISNSTLKKAQDVLNEIEKTLHEMDERIKKERKVVEKPSSA